MSPVDAIRADLKVVRNVLDEARARATVAPEPEPVPTEQLGLF
jgi:hypothetical protein